MTLPPTLIDALLSHAETRPDNAHLIMLRGGEETRRSFAALAEESRRFAALYRAGGVGAGDVVLLFLRTRPDMLAAYYGAMLIGAVPSFMPCPSPKQHPDVYWAGHRALLARIEPAALVADAADGAAMRVNGLGGWRILDIDGAAGQAPLAAAEMVSVRPEDVALLQHSSGTTGLKKGVMLSHGAIMAQLASLSRAIGLTDADVVASWLPIYHDMGLIGCALAPLALGQTVVMLDPLEWSAEPASLLRAINTHHATICWLPNFALAHLCRSAAEPGTHLSSLRLVNVCSEPAKAETLARFVERFALRPERVQVCYGLAESVLAATQTALDAPPRVLEVAADALRLEQVARPPGPGEAATRVVSCGRPVDAVRVRVMGEDGPLPEGRVGEVTLSGACLFDGYYRQPELSGERLRDGWLWTRDLGFMDGGELFVLGRMDDLMIVHGRNIYAHEVEAAANAVPGVKPGRLVAFGVANNGGSEEIVVVAEADGGATLARAVKEAVFQDTGFLVREARLVPPGWLIKTTSGKIARGANRDKYLAGRAAPR